VQSCRAESEIKLNSVTPKWIATAMGDFSFFSPHLQQRGIPNHDGHNPRVHSSILEAEVRERVGYDARSVWFYRDPEAGMMPYAANAQRDLRFPELPLTEIGYDAENTPLIADYIAWKAPQFLMLPDLSCDTRVRLERQAVDQAEQIDRYWRLYPQIHNKDLLKRARVEARIRTANRK
jgi:hypothetical protein